MTNYITEQIKQNIDVRDIAEEHLNLTRNGMAHCPFHSDNTPSFSVSSKKKMFKCFSCGVGGDVIRLYAVLNNVSDGKAIFELGRRLGLSTSKPLPKPIERKYAKKKKDKNIEKRFLQSYEQVYDQLCHLKNIMSNLAKQYDCMEDMVLDDLLIQYYHEKSYHEYLLDSLLDGLLEEISFDKQIDIFLVAKEVVDKWINQFRLWNR